MKNLGPVTAAELAAVGFHTAADVLAVGWREVCRRWVEAFPERFHLTAFYAVIGAERDVLFSALDAQVRAEARAFKAALAKELHR